MSHPESIRPEPALTLESVTDNFTQWRTHRIKRGKIPADLMDQACLLVGHYPMTKITRALGLCFSQFRTLCLERGLIQPKPKTKTKTKTQASKVTFIEVPTDHSLSQGSIGDAPIHMVLNRTDGAALQIAVSEARLASELMGQFLRG